MSHAPIHADSVPTAEALASADHLHRLEQAMEQLNSRIARLALALNISLADRANLEAALKEPHDAAAAYLETVELGEGPAHRVRAERAELRGLLVLRYSVEEKLAESLGFTELQELLGKIEQHMEREGFAHGADGMLPI